MSPGNWLGWICRHLCTGVCVCVDAAQFGAEVTSLCTELCVSVFGRELSRVCPQHHQQQQKQAGGDTVLGSCRHCCDVGADVAATLAQICRAVSRLYNHSPQMRLVCRSATNTRNRLTALCPANKVHCVIKYEAALGHSSQAALHLL